MPPLPFIHQMISLLAQRYSFSAKVHIPISSLLRPKHLSITRKYSPHYFWLWGGNLQMQPPVGSWSTLDLFKGYEHTSIGITFLTPPFPTSTRLSETRTTHADISINWDLNFFQKVQDLKVSTLAFKIPVVWILRIVSFQEHSCSPKSINYQQKLTLMYDAQRSTCCKMVNPFG